jgi:hypothetical protein
MIIFTWIGSLAYLRPTHQPHNHTGSPASIHIQSFDAWDTMITLGIFHVHLHDIDIEILNISLLSTFVSEIVVLDKGSTSGSKYTDAPGSGSGPS